MLKFIFLVVLLASGLSLGWKYSKPKDLSLKTPGFKNPQNSVYQPQTPTLEQIFRQNHKLSEGKTIVLIATGDIIPARSVNYQTVTKNNYLWPFEKTADFLKSADITFINLESPLIKDCPLTNEGMIFCGDQKNIQGLTFAGIDIANLANNHSGNYGQEGIEETIKLLNSNNILVTGVSGVAIKEIKGIKFAFLGFDDINTPLDKDQVSQEIKKAKSISDVVIVTFHWGVEYVSQPSSRQKELAHLAIDSGADLIIGNHPHWIQPVEIYKDKIITYAHGNFIFDQEWSQKTKEGVVGKYTFIENKMIDVEFFPIQINDFSQPSFLEGEQKAKILEEMKNESLKLRQMP